jgi:hypothetical protein
MEQTAIESFEEALNTSGWNVTHKGQRIVVESLDGHTIELAVMRVQDGREENTE